MRLLDLFCGAGGAAMGYHQAGFDEIVGIDIMPQPHYPFMFVQADALKPPLRLDGFDLIHASPPCQKFTIAQHIQKREHPDLLTPIREILKTSGAPWVIENVPRAPMRRDVILCGSAFGLEVRRHRWFELSEPWVVLVPPCDHRRSTVTVFGHSIERLGHRDDWNAGRPREHLSIEIGRRAMGIDWMNRAELSEAIPPAYTRYIGEQSLAQQEGLCG